MDAATLALHDRLSPFFEMLHTARHFAWSLGSAVLVLCPLVLGEGARGSAGGARLGGEAALYTDTNAVTVVTPSARASVTRGAASARGHYLIDIISAASVDIVSSASERWQEVRHEAALGGGYSEGNHGLELAGLVSSEPDYRSWGLSLDYRLALNHALTTLVLGARHARDTAGRTGTPFSIYSQDYQRTGFVLALQGPLDRATSATLELDTSFEHGDSKKPYRLLPVFTPEAAARLDSGASIAEVNQLRLPGRVSERVPKERQRFAFSARVARRYRGWTLRAFQRFYGDSWGLVASSSEVEPILDLSERWFVWGRARSHVQTGVSFWQRAYTATLSDTGTLTLPTYRSGDRELGPLLTGTLGVGARYGLGPGHDPLSTSVSLAADSMTTWFADALYLDGRHALLVSAQLESGW